MSAREDVIATAEAEAREGKIYFWCGGPGAVFVNATRRPHDDVLDLTDCGKSADAAMSCAEYPLLLARLGGHLGKDALKKIFGSYVDTKFWANKQSGTFSWWGYALSVNVMTDGGKKTPNRGDLVFLSTGGTQNDCEHVMLACGGGDVISFGNKHLDPAGATRRSYVNKTTIDAMKQFYQAHFVKFCSPVWAGAFG